MINQNKKSEVVFPQPKHSYNVVNSVIVSLNERTEYQHQSAQQSSKRSIPPKSLSICTCGLYTFLSICHLETTFCLFHACMCAWNEYLIVY